MSKPTGYRFENGHSKRINTQTTAYTLTPNDNGSDIVINSSSSRTVTIPAGVLPIGFKCDVIRAGTGAVPIASDGTSTVNSISGALSVSARYGRATIEQIDVDSFIVSGNLS